jgi:hypothetical protein
MMNHILLAVVITAPLAAGVTSYIEYKLNYNLYDKVKDLVLKLFGKAKAVETAVVSDVKKI